MDRRRSLLKSEAENPYRKEYLTLEALDDGYFTFSIPAAIDSTYVTSVSYSTDNGQTWTTTANDDTDITITVNVTQGDLVLWKGIANGYGGALVNNSRKYSIFSSDINFNVSGNIMSMLYGDNFSNQEVIPWSYAFYCFFYNSKIIDASNLVLPATTLTDCCYYNMFDSCQYMTTPPQVLPASVLPYACYCDMFYYCTSLTTAPEILATDASGDYCCYYMFYYCSSLVTPPSVLAATTVGYEGYYYMFYECTSLESAPEILATTVGEYSYSFMFAYCSSLVTPPSILPAMTLAYRCYYCMFYYCYALERAPGLPATTIGNGCYDYMFYNCSSLSYIKAMSTTSKYDYYPNQWTYGVASSGTFVCAEEEFWYTGSDGAYGIPDGWTISYVEKAIEPTLTFTPAGYVTVSSSGTNKVGTKKLSTYQTMYISTDHLHWEQMLEGVLYVYSGNIYLCGTLTDDCSSSNFTSFKILGTGVSLSGNCNALWDYSNLSAALYDDCGYGMFWGNDSIVSAENLLLPSMTLAYECYGYMFESCHNLVTPPELPATTLAAECYEGMFYDCTSLEEAPEFPATTLAELCYYATFYGTSVLPDCSNIDFTSATVVASKGLEGLFYGTAVTDSDLEDILPKNSDGEYCLPVTTLVERCYSYMFYQCTSLQTAPTLPATTLAANCYYYMFLGCSSLNHIKMLATDISASNCLYYWVSGVAANGIFVKSPSMTSLPSGLSGKPEGWGVQDDGSTDIVYNFGFLNFVRSVTLPAGTYKLECWGAQGGHRGSDERGGKGGYSIGVLTLANSTIVYVRTGGRGTNGANSTLLAGGFNGGGNSYASASGAGASDIRIGTDSLFARVIVAGGGGGAASSTTEQKGGCGGGKYGGTGGQNLGDYKPGTGGSQTARGKSYYGTTADSTTYGTLADFGTGGGRNGNSTSYVVAGGGGGWYGGGYARSAGAGGGSGYVYNSGTASNYPSGCLLNSSHYLIRSETYDGSTRNPSVDGNTEIGHEGYGYVRITKITVTDMSSAVVTIPSQSYTYNGSAHEPTPTVTLNGTTLTNNDYDVSYSNNTNAGTATITVTGKGDYIGTATGTFIINKASRTIHFEDSDGTIVTERHIDTNFTDDVTSDVYAVVSAGDGAITYSISNTTYATINSSTGYITSGSSDGRAVVTATVPETTNYLSASASYNLLVFARVHNFEYTGSVQSITLPASGYYMFECWGAQGGSYSSTYAGGKGGYSVGELGKKFEDDTTVYIYVGGQGTGGTSSGAKAGGFNGGGKGYSTSTTYIECGGGGASDIRIGTDSLYARIIVAGGGGGAGSYGSSNRYSGGAGGGTNGGTPSQYSTSYRAGTGGTQSAKGTSYYGSTADSTTYGTLAAFGVGAGALDNNTSYQITGGGGGWYGGGYSRRGAGGGGSGYVYKSSTASNYPSGCLLNSNIYFEESSTSAGTSTFSSPSGGTETGHSGNGYVRITYYDESEW